jgi:hypothetical protein
VTSSGLYNFGVSTSNFDIFTEAYERIGRQAGSLSLNDMQSASRSLNYLFSAWENSQPNLWTQEFQYLPLTASTKSYTLATNTVAILQCAVRDPSAGYDQDIMIGPISSSEYLAIPNKAQEARRPNQFYFQRTKTPVIYLWQVPDNDDLTLVYLRLRALQDVGAATDTPDAPQRWMEAMAAGIAARLAVKWAPDRVAGLKQEAQEALAAARGEDRQRVPLRIAPNLSGQF